MNNSLVFNINYSKADQVTIDLNTAIGSNEEKEFGAKYFAEKIQGLQNKKILMRINSPGGSVADALQIYDLLNQHTQAVRIEIYGATASAATIIAQAGYRTISENALYLVHHAWGMAIGNRFDMKNVAGDLEKFDQRIQRIYEAKKADMKIVKKYMGANGGHGKWIDANEALEAGLVDEVIKATDYKATYNPSIFDDLALPKLPESYAMAMKQMHQQDSQQAKEDMPRHKVITMPKHYHVIKLT